MVLFFLEYVYIKNRSWDNSRAGAGITTMLTFPPCSTKIHIFEFPNMDLVFK